MLPFLCWTCRVAASSNVLCRFPENLWHFLFKCYTEQSKACLLPLYLMSLQLLWYEMVLCWFLCVNKFWIRWNVAISEKCFESFVSHKNKICKLRKTVLFNFCIFCFFEDQQILCFYFQQKVKSLWLKQMKEQLFWSLETDFITWKVSLKIVSWLQRIMKYKKCLCKKEKCSYYWWLI